MAARDRKNKEKGLVGAHENKGAPRDGMDDRRELMGMCLWPRESIGENWMNYILE